MTSNLKVVKTEHRPPPLVSPQNYGVWISSPDTMQGLTREQRSQQADLHPDPWAQSENFMCLSHLGMSDSF